MIRRLIIALDVHVPMADEEWAQAVVRSAVHVSLLDIGGEDPMHDVVTSKGYKILSEEINPSIPLEEVEL